MKTDELYDSIVSIDDCHIEAASDLRKKYKSGTGGKTVNKSINVGKLSVIAASVIALIMIMTIIVSILNNANITGNHPSDPINEKSIQKNRVQVSNLNAILSTAGGNESDPYFAFLSVPSSVEVDSEFDVDCAFGIDNKDWIFTWSSSNPGKQLDDYFDFSIYARAAENTWNSFFDLKLCDDISFYGVAGDYVDKMKYEDVENGLLFDAGIDYSEAMMAEDLPLHVIIPTYAGQLNNGVSGSIFVGISVESKQGQVCAGNGVELYYYCSDNYIGFGATETEAFNNAFLLNNEEKQDLNDKTNNDPGNSVDNEDDRKTSVIKSTTVDFDGDGVSETIEVEQTYQDDYYPYYSLALLSTSNDKMTFSLSRFHSQWKSYSICSVDNVYFVLEYIPYTNQGISCYGFSIYSYSDTAGFYLAESETVQFNQNGKDCLPVSEMVSFAEKLNRYLDNSEILVSTLDGKLVTEGAIPPERYSWIDQYVPDLNMSLEERLKVCSEIIYNNYHG